MTFQEEVNKLIEKALVEKTFSLEIVEQIKKMRDDYISMEASLKSSKENNDNLFKRNQELETENTTLKARDVNVSSREKVVKEKEDKQALEELKLQNAIESKKEIKELFGIVFKNPVVRSNVYKNTSVPVAQNGYVSNLSGSESENSTIEEE